MIIRNQIRGFLRLFSDGLMNVHRGLVMTIENEDKILADENTNHELETERIKSGLSRMTDEEMQTLFDRAFADFQASMLDPNRHKSE